MRKELRQAARKKVPAEVRQAEALDSLKHPHNDNDEEDGDDVVEVSGQLVVSARGHYCYSSAVQTHITSTRTK